MTLERPVWLYHLLYVLLPFGLLYYLILAPYVLTNFSPTSNSPDNTPLVIALQVLIIAPGHLLVGALIMRRVPGNICGPLLMLWGCGIIGGTAFQTNNAYVEAVSQIYNQAVLFPALFLLLLYFPTGKPYARRVNRWAMAITILLLIYAPLNLLSSPLRDNGQSNPLYLPSLAFLNSFLPGVFGIILGPSLLFSIFLLFRRYRASKAIERQQMKWMAWVALSILLVFVGWISIIGIPELWLSIVGDFVRVVSATWFFASIGLAFGASILQYRLYDIDVIIRRTLIYSILTAALAAIYFGGVVLAQSVLRPLTASSDLAIVLSTLGIAALFNPLRHRIQNTIDRRFFRRKYDAEKTLEAFSAATRDEVDLDKLQAALLGVVQETMQPTKISLWIKESK